MMFKMIVEKMTMILRNQNNTDHAIRLIERDLKTAEQDVQRTVSGMLVCVCFILFFFFFVFCFLFL